MAFSRFLLLCAVLAQVLSNTMDIPGEPFRAPLTQLPDSETIPDVYLVSFRRGHTIADHWRAIGWSFSSHPEFTDLPLFFAYIAELNATSLDLVRQDPGVHFVEADARLTVSLGDTWEVDSRTTRRNDSRSLEDVIETERLDRRADDGDDVDMKCQDTPPQGWTEETQKGAPWHLDYIGAADKLPQQRLQGGYPSFEGGGRGVDIYVLDTGVNPTNSYFGGRLTNFNGLSPLDASPYTDPPEPMYDASGHGTATAGLAGADLIGVARAANLISVKIIMTHEQDLKPKAVVSMMVRAWHDIIHTHLSKCKTSNGNDMSFRGSVILASFSIKLGDAKYKKSHRYAFLFLVKWVRMYGIQIVTASDNYEIPVGKPNWLWPCVSTHAICVGSIDRNYARFQPSGYGPEVAYLAPGVRLRTTSWAGGQLLTKKTGTSFAAPLVAGVAAIFVSWKGLAGGDVRPLLNANALHGVCSNLPDGQPNRLVNRGILSPRKAGGEPFVSASSSAAPENTACKWDRGPFRPGGPFNPRPQL